MAGPDGRVLVLRRSSDDPDNPGRVDFPGGGVDDDEEYAAAAVREIAEEAGLSVPAQNLQLAYAFTKYKEEADAILTRLLYITHTTETAVQLSHEHDAYWWRTRQELQTAFADTSWAPAVDFVLQRNLLEA